jgi:hypothetical protein
MMRFSLVAAGAAALALGSAAALAQAVSPGYHIERDYFHAGPAIPGGNSATPAPDRDGPGFAGQTHVPSLSAQGRGSEHVEVEIIAR